MPTTRTLYMHLSAITFMTLMSIIISFSLCLSDRSLSNNLVLHLQVHVQCSNKNTHSSYSIECIIYSHSYGRMQKRLWLACESLQSVSEHLRSASEGSRGVLVDYIANSFMSGFLRNFMDYVWTYTTHWRLPLFKVSKYSTYKGVVQCDSLLKNGSQIS